MDVITIPQWVSIKRETREKIRKLFDIPKSGSTQVETDSFGVSRVLSDGCTNEDLRALNANKMIDLLGTASVDDSLYDLVKEVAKKIETTELSEVKEISTDPIISTTSVLKCGINECKFETASKFALRMHQGKFHK